MAIRTVAADSKLITTYLIEIVPLSTILNQFALHTLTSYTKYIHDFHHCSIRISKYNFVNMTDLEMMIIKLVYYVHH